MLRRAHYFEALLFGTMKTDSNVIDLGRDVKRVPFMHFLEYLYTDKVARLQKPEKKRKKMAPASKEESTTYTPTEVSASRL